MKSSCVSLTLCGSRIQGNMTDNFMWLILARGQRFLSYSLLYFQLQEHRWQYILVEQMTFSWSSGMFPEEKIEKYLLLAFFFEPLLFTTFFSDFIVTLSLIIFVICLLKSIKNLLNTFMHSAFAEGLSRNILVLDHKQKNLQSN